MKLSYKWISEFVDLHDVTPEALADKLTSAGLEVEGVTPRNQGVSGVVVAEVVACEQHPNADRLRVCQVNVGDGQLRTIVCGAPNVAAGQRVPAALPGAQLPGGSIGVAKLRGIESQGMLCSAKEIGLETKLLPKEQTEGLYILPSDAPVGADVVEYLELDDVVLEIGLTPNRSDCLSLRGFAYEVAALLDRPTSFPEDSKPAASGASPVKVRIDTPQCSRYEAQAFTGVSTGQSPLWMQMRLMAMGVRPINLPVDITNYVMLEWGQPLHAFDLDEVHDKTIIVRQGGSGETLVTLDGETRELTEDTIVISDPDRAIGIAGVMGGHNSEITDGTKAVVLESASFDATSVRKTGQRLGLRSEAQQRFEKGIDPVAVTGAIVRATELFQRLAGASPDGSVVRVENDGAVSADGIEVQFSPDRCNLLLGTAHSEATMRDIFRRLGFDVEDSSDGMWRVRIPMRRPDITLEADLVEEVGRLAGYDAVPTTLPVGPTTVGARNSSQKVRKRTRDVLIGYGLNEVVTYALTHEGTLDKLRIPKDSPYRRMIPLLHPMSEERAALRTHLLPSLAEVASYNIARGVTGGAIFEIGRVYWPETLPLEVQPCERWQLAALWFGEVEPGIGERPRPYDFYDAKGVLEAWLQALGWMDGVQFKPGSANWLHPGRTAEVLLGGQRIGIIGELHPETCDAFDLVRPIYAEFDLDILTEHIESIWKVRRLPKFPSARRDLAVLVSRDTAVESLLESARKEAAKQGESILEHCSVFDIYTGKGIEPGMKSVAVSFRYRAEDRTLTDDEIVQVEQRILERWTEQFGAILRSI